MMHQRAEERTSKGGKPFVTAKVRTAAGEADSLFVNVVAFSESAGAALLALDAVAAALNADPEELLVKARELEGFGLGVLHTNTNTHALQ